MFRWHCMPVNIVPLNQRTKEQGGNKAKSRDRPNEKERWEEGLQEQRL